MPTEDRPRQQQSTPIAPSQPSHHRKPASLPTIAAAPATRNQQDDQVAVERTGNDTAVTPGKRRARSPALAPHSPLRTSSASSSNRNTPHTAQLSPYSAIFSDFACSRLRRHVNLSGWNCSDATLQLLRLADDSSDRAPTLEKLTLDGCERITVAGGFCSLRAPSCSALMSISLERCQGLSADSVAFLPATLLSLSLAYCEWVDDQCVRTLARRCVALVHVSLRHCKRVTDYGVAAFVDASSKPSLACIDIRDCTKVTDVGVLALVTKATKLQMLRASHLPQLEGVNLQGMTRTSNCLATLDMSSCLQLRASALQHLVTVYASAKLTDLNLSSCALVTDDVLVALGRNCPNLQTLRLAACARITDAGVQRLVVFAASASKDTADFVAHDSAATRCVRLETLDLTGCFQLTDVALSAVGRACASLQVLLVDGVRRLSGAGLRVLTAQCPRLHTLYWSGVLIRSTKAPTADATASSDAPSSAGGFFSTPTLDRAALRALSPAAQLQTLHIGNTQCDADALCQLLAHIGAHLCDLDVTAIATDAICNCIGASCPALQTLRLCRSRYFSEHSFLCVARRCIDLRVLDLESCEQIRDASIDALSDHCRHLERLVLANDWQVTDASIARLGERCRSLLTLNVRHCPEVTLLTLQRVAQANVYVVASRDGLTPKHANVVQALRRFDRQRCAARRITHWLYQRLRERYYATHSLAHALRCIRYRKRCCVRIQRCIRRFLLQCRQLALLERMRQERAKCIANNWQWVHTYCVASRMLRTFVRRQLAAQRLRVLREIERKRIKRNQAAVTIQRVARGFLGRRCACETRVAVTIERQRRAAAATTIQRIVRGCRSRASAAVQDACSLRERLVFQSIAAHERCECAVLQLQRIARGYTGRRRSQRRAALVYEQRRAQQRAAAQIQRSYRAHLARVSFQRFVFRTATQLQRVVRGHLGRCDARSIVLERSFVLAPRILLLLARSIFTRAFAAHWKRKRDAAIVVASNIQRLLRGAHGRVLARATRAASRQLWFTRDVSARRLQHFFRSIMIVGRLERFRWHLHVRRVNATTIQATWRMWCAKVVAFARRLSAARAQRLAALQTLLVDAPRAARVQLHFLQRGAVDTIAREYRASLLARGWQAPSYLRHRDKCATQIQALVRGHFGRLYARWYRDMLVYAASTVQRVWRGRVGRKRWRKWVTDRAQRLREQEESDRATRIARKRSSQFALDAYEREVQSVCVLQRWYRTLQRRQVFRLAAAAKQQVLNAHATAKLNRMVATTTESVVFQSRVWRDCMAQRESLLAMDESECVAIESEIAALRTSCRSSLVAAAQAAADHRVVASRMRNVTRTKRELVAATAQVKTRVKPFAVQAKKLTAVSARMHVRNTQLQHELRALDHGVAALQQHLHAVLPLEPLLLASDVAYLLELLELPDGRPSLVADELAASTNQQQEQQQEQQQAQELLHEG